MRWTGDLRGQGPHVRQGSFFSFQDCLLSVIEHQPTGTAAGAMLFLHGRLQCSSMWEPVIRQFTRHFRCVSLDLPGYGESFSSLGRSLILDEAVRLAGLLMEKLGAGRWIVFGQDTGGAIAQLCALQWPERVGALVLVNSACMAQALKPIPVALGGALARRRARRLGRASAPPLPASAIEALAVLQESMPAPWEADHWRERIRQIRLPVLVLCGGKDPVNRIETGFRLAREIPDAVFFEHEEAGHLLCEEEPIWVGRKVGEFLNQLGPAAGIRPPRPSLPRQRQTG